MNTDVAARELTLPILLFGTKWMTATDNYLAAAERGYAGLGFYICGRCGVLGETTTDAIHATLAYFGRGLVEEGWEQSPRPESLADATTAFISLSYSLGAKRFPADVDVAALATLLEAVCDRTDPGGMALFAGWRAMERPDDPIARAAQAMNTFRELRGGLHLGAVRAVGLTPLEALLVRQGEDSARFFGNVGDLPTVDETTNEAWEEAERLTDRATARALGEISAAERDALVSLTTAATTRRL